jgi:hypothetical protein
MRRESITLLIREERQIGEALCGGDSAIKVSLVRGDRAYYRWGVKSAAEIEWGCEAKNVRLSSGQCRDLAETLNELADVLDRSEQ